MPAMKEGNFYKKLTYKMLQGSEEEENIFSRKDYRKPEGEIMCRWTSRTDK
jgi:hypothetical protein